MARRLSFLPADVSTDELALRLLEQQEKEIGVTYGYCSTCGLAVSKRTAIRHAHARTAPRCRRCVLLSNGPAMRTRDARIYLCSQCRAQLTGRRAITARRAAKFGHSTTCGAPECRERARAAAQLKRMRTLPCLVCGEPATPESARHVRYRGGQASCGRPPCVEVLARRAQEKRLAARRVPRERCAVCGADADAESSRRARYRRSKGIEPACRAYCASHHPGQGRGPKRRGRGSR